ncbi:hypothetical protein [Pseudonocardia sp. GCM10023141]
MFDNLDRGDVPGLVALGFTDYPADPDRARPARGVTGGAVGSG